MKSLNKVQLIGNVGQDPESRVMQNGKSVLNMTIATSETWKNKDGSKGEKTEWHRIVSFNDGLNKHVIEPYITKGTKVYVEGKMTTRKYEQNGVEKYSTEIVIDQFNGSVMMLGGGEEKQQKPLDQYNTPEDKGSPFEDDLDEIPGFG